MRIRITANLGLIGVACFVIGGVLLAISVWPWTLSGIGLTFILFGMIAIFIYGH